MNSETFTQFLKTPAYLYRISYQELKSLVVQYPYCQSLRWLLLKKSQADRHAEYDRNLQMAATYSVNRAYLYEQLYSETGAPVARESNVAQEETETLDLQNTQTLHTEKEVLYAENPTPENASSVPEFPSVTADADQHKTEEAGDKDTDISPADSGSAIDELFAEVSPETSREEIPTPDDNTPHRISETVQERLEEQNAEETPPIITDELQTEAENPSLADAVTDEADVLPAEELPAPESPLPAESTLLNKPDAEEEDVASPESDAVTLKSISEGAQDDAPGTEATATVDLDLETGQGDADISELFAEVEAEAEQEEEEEEEETEEETETISPHSSFGAWLKQFNSPQISVRIEDLEDKQNPKSVNYKYALVDGEWQQIKVKKKKKKKKKSEAEQIARESVKFSQEVATETLARLLEKQGHYMKAIRMYEQLSLENPEKSDYFAAKIKTLELKL